MLPAQGPASLEFALLIVAGLVLLFGGAVLYETHRTAGRNAARIRSLQADAEHLTDHLSAGDDD